MKLKLLLGFIILSVQLHAEIVRGKVLDATTKLPIARASVYINNSSIGTSCNDDGVFYLHRFPKPPYRIHISAIGYETTIIEIPKTSDHNIITIFLKPRTIQLAETTIKAPEKNGWKLYGDVFIEEFIGYSDFAKQCNIQNPEVLQFFYNENEGTLRVYAEKPLIVVNNALGYKIIYWLDHFEKNYTERTLFFRGFTQFEDLMTEKTRKNRVNRWQKNRISAYNGSIYHFITSLYHNRTENEGFQVNPLKKITEKRDSIVVIDGDSITVQREHRYDILYGIINPETLVRTNSEGEKIFAFENHLQIIYKNELEEWLYRNRMSWTIQNYHTGRAFPQTSLISLHDVNEIIIFSNGHFEPTYGILLENYWSYEKLDKLLPLDYRIEIDE
jgi:hypothetical protein